MDSQETPKLDPDYESFLICNHPQMVNFYMRGRELATYHKKEDKLVITTPRPFDDLKKFDEILHSAILLLKLKYFGPIEDAKTQIDDQH